MSAHVRPAIVIAPDSFKGAIGAAEVAIAAPRTWLVGAGAGAEVARRFDPSRHIPRESPR